MFGSEFNARRSSMTYDNAHSSAAETLNTSQKGYRKIKNTMKKLLKESSMALGGNTIDSAKIEELGRQTGQQLY